MKNDIDNSKNHLPPCLSLSLHFIGHFSRWTWVSQYQSVSILDFIGAKDDGGGSDHWSYKLCLIPVKLSPPTNQLSQLFRSPMSFHHPTMSKHGRKSQKIKP